MSSVENILSPSVKNKDGVVSILDESLFTGEKKSYKLLCTIDSEFISVAAVDPDKNKFAGFEGFHFTKPLSDEQLVQKISELTLKSAILKKVDFRNVSVQFAGNRFTFIPSALFKPEDAEQYFYFNQNKREGEEIHYDLIRGHETVNIFSVSREVVSGLKKIFEKFSVHHHLTSALDATRFYTPKQQEKTIFIHVHSSMIDVVVTDERKLLFANSFPFKSVEDGIYFVMMTCGQLSLNPERVEVVLSGETEAESPFTKQLKNYIRNISFAGRIRSVAFTYGFDELPQHFYHSAFSHILCEL